MKQIKYRYKIRCEVLYFKKFKVPAIALSVSHYVISYSSFNIQYNKYYIQYKALIMQSYII